MDIRSFAIGAAIGALAGGAMGAFIMSRFELDEGEVEYHENGNGAKVVSSMAELVKGKNMGDILETYKPFSSDEVSSYTEIPFDGEQVGDDDGDLATAFSLYESGEIAEAYDLYMLESKGVSPLDMIGEPYVIDGTLFEGGNDVGVDLAELTYFPKEGVLITEDDEIVDDPRRLLGDNVVDFVSEVVAPQMTDDSDVLIRVFSVGMKTVYEVRTRTGSMASGWVKDYLMSRELDG